LSQLELLHQQLEENEQKVQQLSQTVCQLADQQERLQQKLSDAKNKWVASRCLFHSLDNSFHMQELQQGNDRTGQRLTSMQNIEVTATKCSKTATAPDAASTPQCTVFCTISPDQRHHDLTVC